MSEGSLRVIDGKYALLERLGRGSMGSVYLARHNLTDHMVAIKLLALEHSDSEIGEERFKREVSIASRVGHDGIVKVLDAGRDRDGTLYVAMELLSGSTLRDRSIQPDFTLSYGLTLVRGMLEPLAAAHNAGIVHRDIKPENIFIHGHPDGSEQVKLLDFGIARDTNAQSSGTRTDVGLGTPYYMSPEQVTNARMVTPASDVWSVGVILYWLYAGRLPFHEETPFNTLEAVVSRDPAQIDPGENTFSKQLAALIERCLSKSPEPRPENAQQLLEELDTILGPVAPSSGGRIRYPSFAGTMASQWGPPQSMPATEAPMTSAMTATFGAPTEHKKHVVSQAVWVVVLLVVGGLATLAYQSFERSKPRAEKLPHLMPTPAPVADLPAPSADAGARAQSAEPVRAALKMRPPEPAKASASVRRKRRRGKTKRQYTKKKTPVDKPAKPSAEPTSQSLKATPTDKVDKTNKEKPTRTEERSGSPEQPIPSKEIVPSKETVPSETPVPLKKPPKTAEKEGASGSAGSKETKPTDTAKDSAPTKEVKTARKPDLGIAPSKPQKAEENPFVTF